MTIKDWPLAERPREKLLDRGLDSLSDAELLAIVFGKGFAGCDAVQLARNALSETGGISALVGLDRQRFTAFAGLGDAKFAALHAGIEVGRRALRETCSAARQLLM
jgi:DNA repair protein RadC